jgi:hypothetical protein
MLLHVDFTSGLWVRVRYALSSKGSSSTQNGGDSQWRERSTLCFFFFLFE